MTNHQNKSSLNFLDDLKSDIKSFIILIIYQKYNTEKQPIKKQL